MKATRLPGNPIIRPEMDAQIGENINGPTLLRVPDWIANPLGRYYLYFAHHQGQFIRLAYADSLSGPWRIHGPGALHLKQTPCVHHVASPDVHVDQDKQEVVLYFHGPIRDRTRGDQGQRSFRAVSKDGLAFTAAETILGPFYFRVFRHGAAFYAIAKSIVADGGGVLLRSRDGVSLFEQGPDILPRMRHAAVQKIGDTARIYYSRGGDSPERILVSEMALTGSWRDWMPTAPTEVLSPDEEWEGGSLPQDHSTFGAIHHPVRQLRDPAIYTEEGRSFLLYSVAGERGIAIAELFE